MEEAKEKPMHPTSLTTQILMFLLECNSWVTHGCSFYMPSVQQVFPVGTTKKAQMRFMKRLINDDLVSGCGCGCRGDYEITTKGLDLLMEDCTIGFGCVKEYRKSHQLINKQNYDFI